MPRVNAQKPLLEIPGDFVEKLVELISDSTDAGRQKMASLAEEAKISYKYWLFYFTRTRNIEGFINDLNEAKDAYARWELVKKFLSEGEWNNGSYNSYFLLELVNAIPGYESLDKTDQYRFVLKLKEVIIDRLSSLISDYNHAQAEIRRRYVETQQAMLNKQRQMEDVLIENHLETAKTKANEGDKTVFCLVKEVKWKLSLVNSDGKIYALNTTRELDTLFSTRGIVDVANLSPGLFAQVKTECLKAKTQLLARVQLLVNPEKTNLELASSGINSTFILRHEVKKHSLWWINSLGAIGNIDLKNYPFLSEWLTTHQGTLQDKEINLIKTCLLGVKTANGLNTTRVSELDRELGSIFRKKANVNTPETTKHEAHERALSRLHYQINPEEKNKELLSRGFSSMFILRHTEKEDALWWINSLGIMNQIKLKNYPEFMNWLKEHPAPFNQEDELQLKTHLLAINPSNELSRGRVQDLENKLGSIFNKKAHINIGCEVVPKNEFSDNAVKPDLIKPQPLTAERYISIARLPTLWHQKRLAQNAIENAIENAEQLSTALNNSEY